MRTYNHDSLGYGTARTSGYATSFLQEAMRQRQLDRDRAIGSMLGYFETLRQRDAESKAREQEKRRQRNAMIASIAGTATGAAIGGIGAGAVPFGMTAPQGALYGAGLGGSLAGGIVSGRVPSYSPYLMEAGKFLYDTEFVNPFYMGNQASTPRIFP